MSQKKLAQELEMLKKSVKDSVGDNFEVNVRLMSEEEVEADRQDNREIVCRGCGGLEYRDRGAFTVFNRIGRGHRQDGKNG